jgi:hypothetical protein
LAPQHPQLAESSVQIVVQFDHLPIQDHTTGRQGDTSAPASTAIRRTRADRCGQTEGAVGLAGGVSASAACSCMASAPRARPRSRRRPSAIGPEHVNHRQQSGQRKLQIRGWRFSDYGVALSAVEALIAISSHGQVQTREASVQ